MNKTELQGLVDVLEKGARMYKGFADGLEIADKLRNLAQVEQDLLAAVGTARVKEAEARAALSDVDGMVDASKQEAAKIVDDAKAKAASLITSAENKSLKVIAKQDAQVRDMEALIASTKVEVDTAQRAFANLLKDQETAKSELDALNKEIELTKAKFKQLLG